MSFRPTRREFGSAALGMAALAKAAAAPGGAVQVWQTAGEKRLAALPALEWRKQGGGNAIQLDASKTYQEVLGFGAALTDSACYMFNQLAANTRERLFREIFHPGEMGFNVGRVCVGSSDYAASMYSFDEGEPDPELRRFSIDHDREYILPVLKLARSMNPDLFLLGSPWSPPGWMKANGSMLGGSMRKHYFAPYAQYFVKFLKAYAQAGVPVNAISVQNEVDTDQDSNMPACLWGQEYEVDFVANHLGPQLAAQGLDTKIWILDHNYDLWGRVLDELSKPEVKKFVDGVAWHGYVGDVSAMTRVHEAHPDKHMYWTEGGSDYRSADYLTDWTPWGSNFTKILRNWARCIICWNLALDEKGKPNIGPFECGGMLSIHSQTKEVTRTGLYWALGHYSRAIKRGARRIDSVGQVEGVSHVAFVNPDGGYAAVLANEGEARKVKLAMAGKSVEAELPGSSLTTLAWR